MISVDIPNKYESCVACNRKKDLYRIGYIGTQQIYKHHLCADCIKELFMKTYGKLLEDNKKQEVTKL